MQIIQFLKSAYNQECYRNLKSKEHEKILHPDIAEVAYNKVGTVEKAAEAFEVTGLFK